MLLVNLCKTSREVRVLSRYPFLDSGPSKSPCNHGDLSGMLLASRASEVQSVGSATRRPAEGLPSTCSRLWQELSMSTRTRDLELLRQSDNDLLIQYEELLRLRAELARLLLPSRALPRKNKNTRRNRSAA